MNTKDSKRPWSVSPCQQPGTPGVAWLKAAGHCLLLTVACFALAQNARALTTGVWVYAKDTVTIPTLAYGVNNDWRRVTSTDFSTFASKMGDFGYTLMRYPGGWESEWYDWSTNTTPGWPKAPASAGATPAQVIGTAPTTSFVLRTKEYMDTPNNTNKVLLRELAYDLVDTYKGDVSIWEIGNEWYNYAGDRATNLQRYIGVAKAIAWRIKDADPTALVYINGDWLEPSEFTTMKTDFGNAWAKVDGVALHIYAGDVDATYNLSAIQTNIAAIKTNTGLDRVYVSEWNAAKAYTGTKKNLQAANVQMRVMWHMLRAGIDAATIWPPAKAIDGLNLTDPTYTADYPTGQAFAWMSESMVGKAVSTTFQQVPAVSARDGDQLVVFLLGQDAGTYDVTVHVNGYTVSSVVSADAMYSAAPDTDTSASITSVSTTSTSDSVTVTVNPGGSGRGSSYEIIRLVLNGTVNP